MNPRCPSVLIPYDGPTEQPNTRDIVLYLRPQYNGLEVESTLLRIIKEQKEYRRKLTLVYLANVPGDTIVERQIIERHYSLRLYYAIHGVKAFTPHMHVLFKKWGGQKATEKTVLGAFEALKKLRLSPEDLFFLWVDRRNMLKMLGQSIKRVHTESGELLHIINYDIPALLHMNSSSTNIAVMMFRTSLGYRHFRNMIDSAEAILREKGLVNKQCSIKRIFHYSQGPFEELLDAYDYVVHTDGSAVSLNNFSFSQYLFRKGIDYQEQEGLLNHPLVVFYKSEEKNIFECTKGMSYHETYLQIANITSVFLSPPCVSKDVQ